MRGAIERAERAAGTTPRTLVAVARDERGDYAIEATYAPRGNRLVLDALTVRAKLDPGSLDRGAAISRAALHAFGGNGYVSFGASRGPARTGFEATVCFPDVFPWLAQNTLVVPRLVAIDDVRQFSAALRGIGVAHRQHGRDLVLRPFQLRLRPKREPVVRAFEELCAAGFRASVYAAALPVTRSARVELSVGKHGSELDVALTRGLSRAPCSRADIHELDTFLGAWLGFGLSPLAWRVRAAGVAPPKPVKKPALRVIEGGRAARA